MAWTLLGSTPPSLPAVEDARTTIRLVPSGGVRVISIGDLSDPDVVYINKGLEAQRNVASCLVFSIRGRNAKNLDNHCGFGERRADKKALQGGATENQIDLSKGGGGTRANGDFHETTSANPTREVN